MPTQEVRLNRLRQRNEGVLGRLYGFGAQVGARSAAVHDLDVATELVLIRSRCAAAPAWRESGDLRTSCGWLRRELLVRRFVRLARPHDEDPDEPVRLRPPCASDETGSTRSTYRAPR
jgi:hypothetical protein